MLRTRSGKQNRQGLTDRVAAQLERDMLAQMMKDGRDPKEIAAFKSRLVPNREELRASGINRANRSGKPTSRLTRTKVGKSSLETLIAIHQRQPDGTIRKVVVPRANFEEA
jgi:hypothetical protein